MAPMTSALYETLRSARTGDGSARTAAGVAACYNRFATPESEVARMNGMVGFDLALTAAVLAKLPI